ncbi:MAG: polymer-forming cytoskeletal protein [Lachnospiraceae bacterium]|nr:polymer-forming cytoskeletal protein [Lachnospiraceae bacterium]
MGFFKDFKRDFAQAVNELMPDKDELANEYDDEDMVNTFDEEDDIDIAPEDMMEDLDDFTIGNTYAPEVKEEYNEPEDDEERVESSNGLANIPNAEVIAEPNIIDNDDLVDEAKEEAVIVDMSAETEVSLEDELAMLDELDEENMEENLPDALETESDVEEASKEELKDVDLNKAVEEAILKHDEDTSEQTQDEDNFEEDSMADIATKIDEDIKAKEQDPSSVLADDTTYITKGTTIKGNIETDGGVDIIGTVEGNVTCAGKLIVGGFVKGNVDAGEVYANAAKIEGEIVATGSVKIGVGSVVVGNVQATSAVVAGAVNGDIDVQGPVIVDSTAVIMGNIKSRSVQINNGAVIEGFCSQCYSEIDVKSFFE